MELYLLYLEIKLFPQRLAIGSFQIQTKFQLAGQDVAVGLIRHLSIDAQTRRRCALPEEIVLWLEASSLNLGLRPL